MKNNVFTILKKELARLFGDRKLVFSGIILQGLLLFVMYNLMGTIFANMLEVDDDYQYRISVVNMPDSVSAMISATGFPASITKVAAAEMAAAKEKIVNQEGDLLIEFPADFDEAVKNYDVMSSVGPAPQIQMWYNNAFMESMQINAMMQGLLSEYERGMAKKFDINAVLNAGEYDLNTGTSLDMNIMMSMIPMLLIMLIFTGCMAIAPESIAGEKERGTLGTVLATPARRRDIALAKVVSIAIFGFLGATTSFLGMALSLPNMMGSMEGAAFDLSVLDYLMLFTVIISTVLVFVALLSIMSAYAKSVKEATSYATPFMLLSMFCGLSGMFTGGAVSGTQYYLIPIFNSAQSLSAIFTGEITALNFAATALANLFVCLVLVGVLAKMFSSEKIIFDK